VCVVSTILLIPSYVLVESQLNALTTETSEDRENIKEFRAAEDTVRTANAVAGRLARGQVRTTGTEIIETIDTLSGSGVTVRTFNFSREEGSVKQVEIAGSAITREALASFKEDLERSPLFETALVPISNLARDVDLPFSISITIAEIKQ
jgi:hypothetical protein